MGKVVKRIGTLALQGTASPLTVVNRVADLGIKGLPDLPPTVNELIPDPNAKAPEAAKIPVPKKAPAAPRTRVSPGAAPRSAVTAEGGFTGGLVTPTQRARRAAGRSRAAGGLRRRQTLLTGALGAAQEAGRVFQTRLGS